MSEYRALSWKLQAAMYDDFDVIEEKRRRLLTFRGYDSVKTQLVWNASSRRVSAAHRLVKQTLRKEDE